MRKSTVMIAALALVLGLSQCKKHEEPVAEGQKQHVVLNALFGDNGAKIADGEDGKLKWSGDEVLTVGGSGSGTLECKDADNGIFEGVITASEGNLTFTYGAENYFEQSGALNAAVCLSSGNVPYDENGNYSVTMTISNAVLKLDLKALGTEAGNLVSISVGNELVASVAGVTNDANAVYYVAMPATGEEKTYTFSGNNLHADKTWTLVANTFYTQSGSTTDAPIVIEPGPEPEGPTFRFGGKDMQFAKGNLQAVYQNDGSYKWQFAEHQYDFIGNAAGNNNIGSHSVGDVVDLFCWSSDVEGNYYGLSGSADALYPKNGTFKDWGEAYCSSNGLPANTWRTLSADEWEWILGPRTYKLDAQGINHYIEPIPGENCRTSSTVNGTENARYAFVKVNGVKGMIVFPDVFTWPTDVTLQPVRINGKTPKESIMPPVPPTVYDWNNVDYSVADFEKLEQVGVMFLPVTGYRQENGTVIAADNTQASASANYWTSTRYPNESAQLPHGEACNIGFGSSSYSCTNHGGQNLGLAVRLMRVVE